MVRYSKKLLRLISVIFLFYSTTVFSATSTGSLAVSSTVLATCIVSATPLAFTGYTLSQMDSTATISVTCTAGTTYTVGLNQGTTSGATVTTRKMSSLTSSDLLPYALYSDSGRSTNWGDIGGSGTISSTGALVANTHTVYGRIAANQSVTAGSYTDTVTVTVSY